MRAAATDQATVPTWWATAVLPYADARSAESGLRAELPHQLGNSQEPDWLTFTVGAPVRSADALGRVWFHYSATVSATGPAAG